MNTVKEDESVQEKWSQDKMKLYEAKEQAFEKIWTTKPVYIGKYDKENNDAFFALMNAVRAFKIAEAAFEKL